MNNKAKKFIKRVLSSLLLLCILVWLTYVACNCIVKPGTYSQWYEVLCYVIDVIVAVFLPSCENFK